MDAVIIGVLGAWLTQARAKVDLEKEYPNVMIRQIDTDVMQNEEEYLVYEVKVKVS